MFKCKTCEKSFIQKCHLNRHMRESNLCRTLKERNEENQKEIDRLRRQVEELFSIKQLAEKRKIKCDQLKDAVRLLLDERTTSMTTIEELERKLADKDKKHQAEIFKLNDDKNYLFHKLCIAETRVEEKQQAAEMVVEVAKNKKSSGNKTIINNTVVLQDFRIMPVREFAADFGELTDIIREKGVEKVCQHILEKYYWTIPPNIIINDQARKKISVVRGNKWVQESWDSLVHELYYKCFQKIAFRCIDDRIDYHQDYLDNPLNVRDYEQRARHQDELQMWKYIKETWDNYRTKDLYLPLMVSIKNAQEARQTIKDC